MSRDAKILGIYARLRPHSKESDALERLFAQVMGTAGLTADPSNSGWRDILSRSTSKNERVLVAYPSLTDAVRLGPPGLVEIENTSLAWADMTNRLLDVFRSNRERITLVDAGPIAREPTAWISAVRQAVGLPDIHLEHAISGINPLPDSPLGDLYLMHVCLKAPRLKTLSRELEACSIKTPGSVQSYCVPDLTSALKYLENKGATSLSKDSEVALDLLQEHLAATLESLEAAESSNRDLVVQNDDLRSSAISASARADIMEREIKAVRTSNSWRITAPVRAIVIALRRLTGRKLPPSHQM